MSSQSLDDMISSLLAEDKSLNEKINEGNSRSALHPDNALLAKNWMSKNAGKQIGRGWVYCKKIGHTV